MGEEAKQEQAKAESNNPAEEKAAEEIKEEEEKPKPSSPLVLFVDLHCLGCASKMHKSLLRIRGVEGVTIDMAQNQVTIKGIVEPQAVCTKIMKKTRRKPKVLSPLLPPAEGEPHPQLVSSQVTGLRTVELNVDMHCEACAEQLKTKLLKMRGVQTAVTELNTGKVTVTGTMDANKLVEYVYRRTKKQARIVPQPQPESEVKPEPEKQLEEKKEGDDQKAPAEEVKASDEEKKEENEEKKEDKPADQEAKNEEQGVKDTSNKEDPDKKEAAENNDNGIGIGMDDPESMRRAMYYYQPLYVIERIPPPQLFSDENPNACCIS